MAVQEIKVPDLEGAKNVEVVEIYVSVGEAVDVETPLISLESDKAVMDVPSPFEGTIVSMKVPEGHTVNAGDSIALIQTAAGDVPATEPVETPEAGTSPPPEPKKEEAPSDSPPVNSQAMGSRFHATPAVRGFARELGVDLAQVEGGGPKGRITREDVSGLVKSVMSSGTTPAAPASAGFALPPIPSTDYAAFGEVKQTALSRIKKISGPHLHRNWVGVPHVTQFENADITELEAFRRSLNQEGVKTGATKISPLIFIVTAAVKALKKFPDFNSSLNPDGASITRKAYYNIGIAVDTPDGLVVPVIKNAESKGIRDLAEELGDLSGRAREGKLRNDEMKGASFSISSLGGIGGASFTPIVNAPEVAILGLSKSGMQPVWNGSEFVPRMILPFSVSYDHRVIDGAQGARFAAYLSSVIGDIRLALI